MLLSKVFSSAGLLIPVLITPFVALFGSVDFGTVFMLEHSSGSLLVSGGLVAFLLLARLEGDSGNRDFFVGCVLFIAGVGAFVARGTILKDLATPGQQGQAGLSWAKAAFVVVCYLALVFCHFRFVMKKPEPEVPETPLVITFG